jgi:hypothetical protein
MSGFSTETYEDLHIYMCQKKKKKKKMKKVEALTIYIPLMISKRVYEGRSETTKVAQNKNKKKVFKFFQMAKIFARPLANINPFSDVLSQKNRLREKRLSKKQKKQNQNQAKAAVQYRFCLFSYLQYSYNPHSCCV